MTGLRNKSQVLRWLKLLAVAAFLTPSTTQADQITVFAAASLKNALDEVAEGFDATAGHSTTLSYAGSSVLARQIELGAPADVFISANPNWVGYLQDRRAVLPETRVELLGNQLVLISHQAQPPVDWESLTLPDLLGDGHLAMALVQSVPAGIYGKAALETLGQWEDVAPQVAQMDNVRAALSLVALGEAPFGIVYATDAKADPRVHVVADIPTNSHPAIHYPAVAIHDGDAAAQFLNYIQGPNARSVFERHGFTVSAE
ncbi:MAG: molybdate ABC transporter substrate-binding protein [Pelagimonas sp.]|uniref:molybdate ABC transporter substrate-binding protein n=1 Tax=Pelagimonas sp. TaxID=2073170 RepID=UPI003D6B0212